tara:strand:+ start:2534 stop:3232 length:699 start_codon:yes stop_codon:yes gene_type:complete
MLEGGMKAVFNNFFSFKNIPDIQFDDCSYYQTTIKDVLAFTLAHCAFCEGGEIFGGFLCSIYSGTKYNDIDILFKDIKQVSSFTGKLCNIMENMLGLSFEEYDIKEKAKTYSKSFNIKATIEGVSVNLEVDTVNMAQISSDPGRSVYHPVTWGRTLKYGKNGLSFRVVNAPRNNPKKPTLKYVENMLSEQKDVLNKHYTYYPRNEADEKKYLAYKDCKLSNLKKEGYEILSV